MAGYRYQLEKRGALYECPQCGKKEFTRYIDTDTNQHIDPTVGKCSRIIKCQYHYHPRQYFKDNESTGAKGKSHKDYAPRKTINLCGATNEMPKPTCYIETGIFMKSLQIQDYEENTFVQYLLKIFGSEITNRLIEKYYIGNSTNLRGATVFWQVDFHKMIRSGKVILYNPDTGKRIRNKKPTWMHSVLKLADFNLAQCLFGEHLLKGNNATVALVESEKTAIIASMYLPQFIWLATGGLTNFAADKCQVLQGRKVVLYPDLNGFEIWSKKAKELSHIARITVSDLLEKRAGEEDKKLGLDIADFLVRINLQEVHNQIHEKPIPDILSILVDECASMSLKFNSDEITNDQYADYCKQLSDKLSAARISFQEFVCRTKDL